ncbi:beta/gamma crystallin-related protein [Ideonella sp. A 288]|uniref:beta/gamma crystallin-related protein n=1 Tax=Ideonella sp. A 288 TaxID=1962181 RepID=UPI001303B0CE|nr:beta/gamma crystallin-related protein [Ideonella sp. A 288]
MPTPTPRPTPHRLARAALLAVAGTCAALPALAQEVELFERARFKGVKLKLTADTPDVAAYGLGNRIASIVVKSGDWEFCTAPRYGGACITVGPGRYADLPPALHGNLASIRRADGGAGAPPPAPATAGTAAPGVSDAVVLYEHIDFKGRSFGLSSSIARLDEKGFNDTASSVLVQRGRWQLCEHADFSGQCIVLGPGRHTLGGNANDLLSSIRPVFGRDNRPLPASGGLVLHEQADYSGRSMLLTEPTANLKSMGMNDKASSVEVLAGQWEVCTDADYRGRCVLLNPGHYQLDGALDKRLSSMRPR